MKAVPSYTKILTLGSSGTENALIGPVVVQEKVDGSQFGFGINEDGEIVMRSKGVALTEDDHADMFSTAVEYILSIKKKLKTFPKDTYFYSEYLEKPKHNTLVYSQTPKNNLVLFDSMLNGAWVKREDLKLSAKILGIDLIPELYIGKFKKEDVTPHLDRMSYLGNTKIEGIVIKNYQQTVLLGGHLFPLFTKYVSEAFKEKNDVEWKTKKPRGGIEEYIKGFTSEARWQKSIIHAKELGKLENSPKDIGMLLKMIQQDIFTEETENIKKYLFNAYKDEISRRAILGFPQWYKKKLLENLN